LFCETDIKLICSAIDVPYYVHLAGKKIEDEFLGNQYVACLSEDIQATCQDYMNPEKEPDPVETGDVCAIFYEDSRYADSVARAVRSWRNDELLWWRARIGNPTPGTKVGTTAIPLLQVADFGSVFGNQAGSTGERWCHTLATVLRQTISSWPGLAHSANYEAENKFPVGAISYPA
jgi:hypothetical protein